MAIYQCPVGITVQSTLLAPANLAVQIPGTFSGYPPTDARQARYFQSLQIVSDSITPGDWVDTMVLSDDSGVLSSQSSDFPSYPTIINFSQDAGIVSGAKGGIYFNEGVAILQPINGTYQLLPSQLWLKGVINPASLSIVRTYRVNILWGAASTASG